MTYFNLKTKPCPFCAEVIQARAMKCRFCGEFLNTAKARALEAEAQTQGDSPSDEHRLLEVGVMFAGRPSLFGMMSTMIKGLIMLVIVWLIIKFPIENMINNHFGLSFSEELALTIGRYREMAGWAFGGIVIFGILYRAFYLKMIYYEVSADRIEWSRGILDRRVDNLDMFRVIDLKLRRSIIDCIFGIGTVALVTTDKSDPEFVFEKVRHCRELYDIIKRASLEADRRTGVVHLE
ncbi:MAG: PH domain-containing protein [Sedimentisphaerales bacterium]|nr:PH domain-containing protein [Sedimentisphaerales bacterium]